MNSEEGMLSLLEKIEASLKGSKQQGDIVGIGVVEGEMRNIESLLYILKGKGVIGVFTDTPLSMGREKESLEDLVYFFDVDRKKFEEYKKNYNAPSLHSGVHYNVNTGVGWANGKRFKFKDQKPNFIIFGKLYEQIGRSLRKEEIWEMVGHKENTDFINDLVKELREKTGFSTDELVLNNSSITLATKKLEMPPVVPQ